MGRLTGFHFLKNGKAIENSNGATKLVIVYKNNIENRSYFDINNKPADRFPGIHKYSIQRNSQTNQIVVKSYNIKNVHTSDLNGVSTYIYTLNPKGWIIKEQYQDTTGHFIADNSDCMGVICKWSEDNISYKSDINYQFRPDIRMSAKDRIVREISTYDKKLPFPIKVELYENEQDSINIVKKTLFFKFNYRGNLIEEKKYRSDNNLFDDFFYYWAKYDIYGNLERIKRKESVTYRDGKKVFLTNGNYILCVADYSSKSEIIKFINCNAKNDKVDFGDGYVTHECIRDSLKRTIEERYYDIYNNLIDTNIQDIKWDNETHRFNTATKRCAKIRKKYDGNRIIKTYFYNANNELISEE